MRKSWIIWCAAALLLGYFAGAGLRYALVQGVATLDVEAMITKGTVFRVYSDNTGQPQLTSIHPGEWTHYKFHVPSRITSLRFDPSEETGAKAYIRSIVVSAPGKESRHIDVSHLRNWIGSHVTAAADPATGSVVLTTDSPNAYWMGGEDITLPNRYAILGEHFHLDDDTLLRSLLVAGVIVLLAGIRRANLGLAMLSAAVIVIGLISASLAARYLTILPGPPIPVNHAVGGGAFTGLSLSGEFFAVNVSIALALTIALIAGLIWNRFRTGELLPGMSLIENPDPMNLWIFGLFAVLLAAFLFPPSADILNRGWNDRNFVDSDSQTVFTWQFLVYHGALPWRDFWFPYGGFADRMAPVYPYFIYEYANQLLLMAVLVWSALKIFANRWGPLLGICAVYLVLGAAHVVSFLASERYLLCLSVLVLCAVAAREASLKYFLIFGIWCSYVVTQEASQLAYAVPGSIVLLAVALAGTGVKAERIRLFRAIAAGALAALGGILVYFVFLYSRSQLGGWIAFMTTLNDSAAYSAGRAPLAAWFSDQGNLISTFLIALIVLLASGVLHLTGRKTLPNVYSFLPLSIGVLGWFLLQKEVMRSGIITQILPIPILGLIILVLQVRDRMENCRPTVALNFVLAFIFGCFVMDQRLADSLRSRLMQSERLPSHISAAFFHSAGWAQTAADYFSPDNLRFGDITGAELRGQLSSAASVGFDDTIYVLGNNSEIYALFGKTPPYSIYLYNMSPIDLQLRTISWLQQKRAKYVFWDFVHNDFDGVPNEVRLPLLFDYIVEHYKPLGANSRYRILKRMDDGEKPALDFWFSVLGSAIDLGSIPAASDLTGNTPGGEHGIGLVVTIPQPVNDTKARVTLALNGQLYTILFTEKRRRSTYLIRLDRIPIIAAGISSGASLQVVCCDGGTVPAEIRTITVPHNDLY